MRQAESSRVMVQQRNNSCLREAFVFFLWHTSRHQPIAVIGGQCRSRADNLQSGTVEAGRVTPCAQEQLTVVFTVPTHRGVARLS